MSNRKIKKGLSVLRKKVLFSQMNPIRMIE